MQSIAYILSGQQRFINRSIESQMIAMGTTKEGTAKKGTKVDIYATFWQQPGPCTSGKEVREYLQDTLSSIPIKGIQNSVNIKECNTVNVFRQLPRVASMPVMNMAEMYYSMLESYKNFCLNTFRNGKGNSYGLLVRSRSDIAFKIQFSEELIKSIIKSSCIKKAVAFQDIPEEIKADYPFKDECVSDVFFMGVPRYASEAFQVFLKLPYIDEYFEELEHPGRLFTGILKKHGIDILKLPPLSITQRASFGREMAKGRHLGNSISI